MHHKINTLKKKALLLSLQVEILERFEPESDKHWFAVEIDGQHIDSIFYYLSVDFKTSGSLCDDLDISTDTDLTKEEVSNAIDEILSEIIEPQKTCNYCGLEIDGDFCSKDCLEAELND